MMTLTFESLVVFFLIGLTARLLMIAFEYKFTFVTLIIMMCYAVYAYRLKFASIKCHVMCLLQ